MSKKAKRVLPLLNDPKHRNKLVGVINLFDQEVPAQVSGGDKEMKVLSEVNELQEFQDEGSCLILAWWFSTIQA